MLAYFKTCEISAKYDLDNSHNSNKYNYPGVYQLCVPVHKEYDNKGGDHKTAQYNVHRCNNNVKVKRSCQPQNTVEKFNHRVPCRDLCTACTALSSENAPAYDRDKITAFDLFTTGHAVRISFDKTFVFRKSVNADVKKTSDADTKNEDECINNNVVDL